MRIFLIGFMGCGKSSIGEELAKSLNYSFLDLDHYIEKNEDARIVYIFNEKGEDEFRKIEHTYLKNIVLFNNTVIATGGGTPCYFNNMEIIKHNGVSIYLKYNADTLSLRLFKNKNQRPLLKEFTHINDLKTYINVLLKTREHFYMQSDIILEEEKISVNTIVEALLSYLV